MVLGWKMMPIEIIKEYLAILKKNKNDISLYFPEIPIPVITGEKVSDVIDKADEALTSYVEELLNDGLELPEDNYKALTDELKNNSIIVNVQYKRTLK
jgi:predicted RNase H-like HicB family nuclease